MSFLDTIKDKLAEQGAAIATGAMTGLLIVVGNALAPEVIPILSSPALQKAVVPILAISLIVNCLLFYWIWSLNQKPKFRTRFGFYWDSDAQPHCPACESPMQWGEWAGTHGPGLLCGKCKDARYLADDAGKEMSIEAARIALGKK